MMMTYIAILLFGAALFVSLYSLHNGSKYLIKTAKEAATFSPSSSNKERLNHG